MTYIGSITVYQNQKKRSLNEKNQKNYVEQRKGAGKLTGKKR